MRVFLCLFLFASMLLSFEIAGAEENRHGIHSADFVYKKCKEAITSNQEDFENSYCAAFFEGYVSGGSVIGLATLSKANNQKEIIEQNKTNKCKKYTTEVSRDRSVKPLAKYFIDWIDNNQKKIKQEKAFLDREAAVMFYTISTDERFCEIDNIAAK